MTVTELERLAQVRAMILTGEARGRREAAGLSLSEVASACGVDTSTVWRWERGLRVPRGESAQLYARALAFMAARQGPAS